jgi:hypothetical protein
MICPNCGCELDLELVNMTGTPDIIASIRQAWSDAEQAAMLREAKRGEKDDPTW